MHRWHNMVQVHTGIYIYRQITNTRIWKPKLHVAVLPVFYFQCDEKASKCTYVSVAIPGICGCIYVYMINTNSVQIDHFVYTP